MTSSYKPLYALQTFSDIKYCMCMFTIFAQRYITSSSLLAVKDMIAF